MLLPCMPFPLQSFGDNAEKYLRIGRSSMTLGNFVGKQLRVARFVECIGPDFLKQKHVHIAHHYVANMGVEALKISMTADTHGLHCK